jgi:hypothetical protein
MGLSQKRGQMNTMLAQMVVEDFRLAEGREMPGPDEGWMCAQLREGLAYRLGADNAEDLPLGGVVLLLPGARAVVRASQLRACIIRRFEMRVESMAGILTIEEDTALRCLAEEKAQTGWTLPPEHPAALELSAIAAGFGRSPGQRIQLLGLALDIVGPLPNSVDESDAAASPTAAERFRRLMGEIPEGELMQSSPDDLARRCRCTVRHLNRLFRQTYGVALRAKLRELQLRSTAQPPVRQGLPVR